MVIDLSSCKNVISKEAAKKLGLKTEPHPHPYKLSWLKKGNEVTVNKHCLVSFLIGSKCEDDVVAVVLIDYMVAGLLNPT